MGEVRRFNLEQPEYDDAIMQQGAAGDWMFYVDHAQIVAAKDAAIAEAKAELATTCEQLYRVREKYDELEKLFRALERQIATDRA